MKVGEGKTKWYDGNTISNAQNTNLNAGNYLLRINLRNINAEVTNLIADSAKLDRKTYIY